MKVSVNASRRASRRASRGEHIRVFHAELVGIHIDSGEARREGGCMFPVGGDAAPLQQTGFCQHMRTQAQAHDLGTPRRRMSKRSREAGRGAFGHVAPARHHDGVGLLQRGEGSETDDPEARVRAQRPRLGGTPPFRAARMTTASSPCITYACTTVSDMLHVIALDGRSHREGLATVDQALD